MKNGASVVQTRLALRYFYVLRCKFAELMHVQFNYVSLLAAVQLLSLVSAFA